jgi:uncharacterized protein YqgV (UPF0045/DUF77 family)
MVISAQLSLYPLRQEHLALAIQAAREALLEVGLQPHVGPMSTVVTGEVATVFAGMQEAFVRAAASGDVVMTVTLSNACPMGG